MFRYGDIVSLAVMMRILNILSPSVTAYLINEAESSIAKDFSQIISEVTDFTRAADAYLSELVEKSGGEAVTTPETSRLFEGLGIIGPETTLQYGEHVDRFSSHMIQDIRNNWLSSEASITIKAPSRSQRPSTTQSGQGTSFPKWEQSDLLQVLREQMRTWNHAHDMITKATSYGALIDEILF
ncbi:hypothetical protein RRF57_012223 [Xylaria bambusicola]|uniref:Uncharacterized protein n=1 Tax=Xylaria bambusicola TaxID=326684 RepID=A0AAN7V1I0_9PEZI